MFSSEKPSVDIAAKKRPGQIMQGSCGFEMPGGSIIERNVVSAVQQQRTRFVNTLTRGSKHIQGLMDIGRSASRGAMRLPEDPVRQYVQRMTTDVTDKVKQNKATFVKVN